MAKSQVKELISATGLKGSLNQIKALIRGHMQVFFEGDTNVFVPYVKGPPGIGKTDMVHQLADEFHVSFKDLPLIIWDTVDMRGVPYTVPLADGGIRKTHWALPSELPTDGRGILFLDEFTQAFQSLQNCSSRLILARELGEYRVPDGWFVVLASNREGDKAATHRMASFLNNRVSHYEIEPTLPEWRAWALAHNVHERIIAYLSAAPHMLHQFNADHMAFPSPRSWAAFSKLLTKAAKTTADIAGYCIATVGEGAADEFMPYWEETATLPTYEDILAKPKTTPVPQNPSPLYAVSIMLGMRLRDGDQERIWEYVMRLPQEYAYLTLFVILVRPDHEKIGACNCIIDFIMQNPDYMNRAA